MPLIAILLLVLLIAQIGFSNTAGAILGLTASIIVALLLIGAIDYSAIRHWLAHFSR